MNNCSCYEGCQNCRGYVGSYDPFVGLNVEPGVVQRVNPKKVKTLPCDSRLQFTPQPQGGVRPGRSRLSTFSLSTYSGKYKAPSGSVSTASATAQVIAGSSNVMAGAVTVIQ